MGYVFISYSSKNQEAADSIHRILEKNGIQSWMAPGDIPVGEEYPEVIDGAIENCACLLLLLTNNAQNSNWVPKEVERAISYGKRVFPLKLEDVELNKTFKLLISSNHGISLSSLDEAAPEMQRVLRDLKAVVQDQGQPAVQPQQPVLAESKKEETKGGQKKAPSRKGGVILAAVLLVLALGIGGGYLLSRSVQLQARTTGSELSGRECMYLGRVAEKDASPDLYLAQAMYHDAGEKGIAAGYTASGRLLMALGQYGQAKDELEKAEKAGDPGCYVLLGRLYLKGLGTDPAPEKAAEYFMAGRARDDNDAMFELAGFYAEAVPGSGIEENRDTAIDMYRELTDREYYAAAYELGKIYEDMYRSDTADQGAVNEAVVYYQLANDNGYAKADTRLRNLMSEEAYLIYRGQATGKGEEAESQQQEQALAPVSSAQAEDGTLDAAVLARAEKGEAEAIMAVAEYYWYGNEDKNIAPDYKKAKEWFERPEVKENNTALVALGIGYYNGYFDERGQPDYQKAFGYYTAAAKRGNEIAMNNLGAGYTNGYFSEDGQPDYTEARDWYVAAAKLGYKKSMYNLGKGYDKGYYTDGKPDVKNAEKWYTEAADRGHGNAAEKLVTYYLSGKTDENGQVLVEKDPEKALHYLNVAYEGNHRCNYVLSWLGWYHAGNSEVLAADYPKAVGFYEEAAANGDTYSMEQLAKIYSAGQLGSPDMGKAIEWYEKAAAADSAYAAETLAQLYRTGKMENNGQALVETDDEKALEYLEKAYQLNPGSRFAQVWLGWYYAGNSDVLAADDAKALMFFQMAAEQGEHFAMYQLGEMYEGGRAVKQDMQQALAWYEKAAQSGQINASEKLAELYHKGKTDENGQVLVEKDDEKALEYLEKAYEINPDGLYAQVWLGWFYAGNSEVLEADYEKAVAFYEAAAGQGDAYSMCQLGLINKNGQYGQPDFATMEKWFGQAAELGNKQAAHELCYMYTRNLTDENGHVLAVYDEEKAFHALERAYMLGDDDRYVLSFLGWFYDGNSDAAQREPEKAAACFEAAAQQGDGYSMVHLGKLYLNDETDLFDPDKAKTWLEKALETDSREEAQELLDGMALLTEE